MTAAVATDFTLNASYGYTYATFKDYITNEKVNGELQEISYNGKSVPFVPKHTMNVGGSTSSASVRGTGWTASS